jgi:hypothetical protein
VALPAKKIQFRLGDLKEGKAVSKRSIRGFDESVSLRLLKYDLALDHEFEFIDTESPEQGDYYFIRVRQLDGGMAWSSPVWIGGFSKRHDHFHHH